MKTAAGFTRRVLLACLAVQLLSVRPVSAQLLPYYRETTCGPNCLYAVCLLKSVDTTLTRVCQLAKMTEEGTSMLNLVEAARELGLDPKPLKTTVEKFAGMDGYAIVHLNPNHFILCVGWRDGKMVVVDPPKDPYQLTREELQKEWTGYVILFDRSTHPSGLKKATQRATDSEESGSAREGEAEKSELAISSSAADGAVPGMVRMLLGSLQRSKASRDGIRRLFGLVNKPAPEITPACWLNSKPLSLAKLRGRVVVVEFWNIGCGPCLAGIPELNEIQETKTAVPVTLIAVHSYTEDIEAVKQVMSQRNIRYPVCVDARGSGPYSFGGTLDRCGFNSVPQRFLIDIHGRVRAIHTSVGPELEELVQESADGLVHETEVDLGWMVEVKVVPKRVIFGRVEAGRSVQKSVYIYKPDRPAFAVDLASRPAGPGGAELFRYQAGDETLYELRILLDAAAGGGAYASQVRLTTNDPNLPEIAVPITAELAGP
jgi:thiol-disulfide isomerase/thioredoxin